jgi:hypothetical protein
MIIGAERCATRWLRHNLDRHPDIYAPPLRAEPGEVPLFCGTEPLTGEDVREYRKRFLGWDGEAFLGECEPAYMWPEHDSNLVAQRMNWALPDVKLLAIVRQPVDRFYSAALEQVRCGRLPADVDLFGLITANDPIVDELRLISSGAYSRSIEQFQLRFGDRLLVLLYDDLQADPEAFYEAALRHIGASTDFVSPDLHRVLFGRADAPGFEGPALPLVDRQRMYIYARFGVENLEKLIERELPEWDLGVSELEGSAAVVSRARAGQAIPSVPIGTPPAR